MNKLPILVAAFAAFSTTVAFAATDATSSAKASVSCDTCIKPVPVHVVAPTQLPSQAMNSTVAVALTIDEQGVPHDVKPLLADPRVVKPLKAAIAQWRFTPEYLNGRAVSTTAVLPVTLAAN